MVGADARGYTCAACMDWHWHALEVLGGATPLGCQECGKGWEQLKTESLGDEVRMYCHPKDGMYQLLCGSCNAKYVPLRRDLYGNTQFGKERNL